MGKCVIGVTGINGFIGNRLCEELLGNPNIRVCGLLKNPQKEQYYKDMGIKVFLGDIRDESLVNKFSKQTDVIIHTAAKLGNGCWDEFYTTNVIGTENIAKACISNKVKKLIYLSTIEVYGNFDQDNYTEDQELELCKSHYVDSKILAEQLIKKMLEFSKTRFLIVRPGMVYGPNSYFWTKRLYDMVKVKRFSIIGNGEGIVYPIYIDNLIDAIMRLINYSGKSNEVFNLVDFSDLTWKRWGDDYGKMCGVSNPFKHENLFLVRSISFLNKIFFRSGRSRKILVYTRKSNISTRKANIELGWYPKVGYTDGMKNCKTWLNIIGNEDTAKLW